MSLKCLNRAAHIDGRIFPTKVLCHGIITHHRPNTLFLPQGKGMLIALRKSSASAFWNTKPVAVRSLMVSLALLVTDPLILPSHEQAAMCHMQAIQLS